MAVQAPEIAAGVPEQVAYALDVAAAGAMHAGRIHLIATEAGAGVRSAGELRAHAQDLRLDVGGALRLANAHARRDFVIEAAGRVDVDRGAALGAERDLTLRCADLVAVGVIHADGDLRLDVADLYSAGGTLRSGRDMRLHSASNLVNGRQSGITAGGALHAVAARELANHGAIEGAGVSLQAAEACINRAAALKSTQGELDVAALSLDNRRGTIQAAAALHVRLPAQGSLHNAGGVIQTGPGKTKIASGMLGNSAGGVIEVAGDLQARVSDLLNTDGTLRAGGRAQIECRDKLANGSAQIRSARALTLRVGSEADNDLGKIESGGDLDFTLGGILSNVGGRIGAEQGELRLQAPTAIVVNDGGDIGAGRALRVDAASLSNGSHSRIIGDDVSLRVGDVDNVAGRIVAQRTLRIAASAIDNGGGGRLVAGDSAVFDVERLLRNSSGRIHVHGDELVMRVPHGEIDNRGGELRLPLAQSRWVAQTVLGELNPADR
ncbi:hemagluttinin repeat protein [mine drainage metagenome]|uniref:Hemagluttinin repeat protein n=1 Tax=mine drainage metagenome TaxID=410659 RepID=A0A1J5QU64_9ZZZZ